MSIEEIKDIKKLQQMLKSELELRKSTYKCCQEAGEELAKNSFAWDGKEKNLVIQARELNERFEAKKQECERLRFPMQDTNYAILAKEEFEEYKKFKQTLIEIKEIVFPKNQLIITDSPIILKIQEKISECEVKSENKKN